MSSAASGSDHTVNKIAFYSAIFAGVAYVGYTVVKDAFKKKNASQGKLKKFLKARQVHNNLLESSQTKLKHGLFV